MKVFFINFFQDGTEPGSGVVTRFSLTIRIATWSFSKTDDQGHPSHERHNGSPELQPWRCDPKQDTWCAIKSGFQGTWKNNRKTADLTVRESLIGDVESSFPRLTDVGVADDDSQVTRVAKPVPVNLM